MPNATAKAIRRRNAELRETSARREQREANEKRYGGPTRVRHLAVYAHKSDRVVEAQNQAARTIAATAEEPVVSETSRSTLPQMEAKYEAVYEEYYDDLNRDVPLLTEQRFAQLSNWIEAYENWRFPH